MKSANRKYNTGDPALDERIDDVVRLACTGAEREFVREMMTSVMRMGLDCAQRGDLKITNTALKELRRAFKVFTPYRRARKVTVFGSARTKPGVPDYDRAVDFGRQMAEEGWMVVTGAGSGIMGAAHRGAGRSLSVGVNIKLPFEQDANETIRGDKKLMNFRYFFTRKLFLLKESHAVVLFPGGFGTLDECFEVLTLLQTGKQTPMPVVMIESPETGYFRDLMEFVEKRMLNNGLISPADLSFVSIVKDPREACNTIFDFYRNYHSSRYVARRLILRLKRELEGSELAALNKDFADLLLSGAIEPTQALPEEKGTHLEGLARIQMDFNRHDFGRLREMIDAINKFGGAAGPSSEV